MPIPLFQIFIFIAGLILLLKGADWITKYASRLAVMWGLSQFEIGLTIVAIATSLPELTISMISGLTSFIDPASNAINIATGTIIGSNIANIGLVLGFGAVLRPIITTRTYMKEEYFMGLLTILFATVIFMGFGVTGGLIIIAAFLFYLGFLLGRRESLKSMENARVIFGKIVQREALSSLVFALIGGVILVIGSMLIISSVLEISVAFGVSEFMISIILIAIGTSLPELSASAVAAVKNLRGIAIGNIIGSNIFNILILAVTSLMTHIIITPQVIFNVYILLIFTFLLLIFSKSRLSISKKEGAILFGIYIIFIALQGLFVV